MKSRIYGNDRNLNWQGERFRPVPSLYTFRFSVPSFEAYWIVLLVSLLTQLPISLGGFTNLKRIKGMEKVKEEEKKGRKVVNVRRQADRIAGRRSGG